MKLRSWIRFAWPGVPILMALFVTTLILIFFDTSPKTALLAMVEGSFGDKSKVFQVLAFLVPLMLSASGLLVTFTAGLWNIGVEGQIIIGAIMSSWVALKIDLPTPFQISLELLAAIAGGALWAGLVAVLKTRGGVNEIFSGLALNNIAIILTNYLISGPWQPPEGGTFRGTQPFAENALLPLLGESRFSPLSLVLALIAFGIVVVALRGTFWGLKLKALGKNPKSAFLLGVSSERELILALMFCGALAGLGGGIRVLSWFDSLRQSISGGIGFLALLVVMLSTFQAYLVPPIALFFSIVLMGSTTLHMRSGLHPSLGGILTGVMVLFVLLFGDYGKLFTRRKKIRTSIVQEASDE